MSGQKNLEPYRICFENPNGRVLGDFAAETFTNLVFDGCIKPNCVHHDRMWEGHKIEIKAIRAAKAKVKIKHDPYDVLRNDLVDRALFSIQGDQLYGLDRDGKRRKIQNDSFQQTKSAEFDFFIGYVFFLDLVRVYVIPSKDIASSVEDSENKIKIISQHRNTSEGHMNLDAILKYMKFEISLPFDEIKPRALQETFYPQ